VFPFDNPPTRIGEPSPEFEPVTPPSDDTHVASKRVIALPPLAGATNATVTAPFRAPTAGAPGTPGTVLGMAAADAGDAAPGPFAFVAVTRQVYDCPFVNPPTTIGEAAPETEPAVPLPDDVHVAEYPVIALPPLPGAWKATVSCPFPEVRVGASGAAGTVLGTTADDAAEAAPEPFAFVAVTRQV
jgi:hypothetical protein